MRHRSGPNSRPRQLIKVFECPGQMGMGGKAPEIGSHMPRPFGRGFKPAAWQSHAARSGAKLSCRTGLLLRSCHRCSPDQCFHDTTPQPDSSPWCAGNGMAGSASTCQSGNSNPVSTSQARIQAKLARFIQPVPPRCRFGLLLHRFHFPVSVRMHREPHKLVRSVDRTQVSETG